MLCPSVNDSIIQIRDFSPVGLDKGDRRWGLYEAQVLENRR